MFSARKRTRRFFPPSMEMPAEYAAPLGFGRWNKKRKAPPIDLQAAGPSSDFEIKGLALAGGFGHFRCPFVGAPLHLIGRDVLHVLRKAPLVAKRVGDFPVAVSPELIGKWHVNLGACGNSTVEGRVHIFCVQEDINGVRGTGRWRAGHAGKLVSNKNH